MLRLPERDYEQPKRIRDELIGSRSEQASVDGAH